MTHSGYQDVKRVKQAGDPQWMNRLIMELNISPEEALNGYREIPAGTSDITDVDGTYLPSAAGKRRLPDGR